MKKEYESKYNFNIEVEKTLEKNKNKIDEDKLSIESLPTNKSNSENNYKYSIIQNEENPEDQDLKIYYETFSPIEKEKIVVDSLNNYQQLKKRIEINKKIFSIFLDNYYIDEFNNSRRGFYLLFSFPFMTFFGFLTLNPFHPLRRPLNTISFLGPMLYLMISFRSDIENISAKNTNLGTKVNYLFSIFSKLIDKDIKKSNWFI